MSDVEERAETSVDVGSRAARRAEPRMLVDGHLVESASGARLDNFSPATGQRLGDTAAADPADMDRAIAAARRAFDECDWPTNRRLRRRCLEQLQSAIEAERDDLREELIAEVGCPAMTTQSAQLDWPLAEALRYPAGLAAGHYVAPTVVVGVDNSAAIAQQEIFGPVLVVMPFDDDDEVVRIANDSAYGLAGAVASRSMERGMSIARRIRTGSFGVNGGMFYGADAPFGGYKNSGVGRQCGIEGFQQYLETKTIGCRVPRQK